MDQRRYFTVVIATMGFYVLWSMVVAPLLFPQVFAPPKPQQVAQQADDPEEQADENLGDGAAKRLEPEQSPDLPAADDAQADKVPAAAPNDPPPALPEFPNREIVLGQAGFDGGFLIQAQINTAGAAVDWIKLTDGRYTTLDRKDQLKVIGNEVTRNVGDGPVPRTFATSIPDFERQLAEHDLTLSAVDWEIVDQEANSVTLRYPIPDGTLEALKTFRLTAADVKTRDESPDGYLLEVDFTIRNTSPNPVDTAYTLQGPVGVPLENVDNTRIYREVKVGTLEDHNDPEDVTSINLTAANLVKQFRKAQSGGKPVEAWRESVQYAGIDEQFFAALIFPDHPLQDANGDGTPEPYFELVRPDLLFEAEEEERSDFSIAMESSKITLGAGQDVTHSFRAFFGPKRTELLQPLLADGVMNWGWFGAISKLMLGILSFFHSTVGLPYAFAIILLTVCVRGAMFPISKKQAIESEKMKVLAPKLKEIQEKHKGNPEEFAKAYREFQKKYNYHPMVGCLPALLQIPIFMGLYYGLFQAIDLRLAKFLWIDNLAAPDALFQFGFRIPLVGFTEFNLLPLLTVGLFIVQQKMFTPPPTSEEQEMTYKMMNYMMVFMGFLFYRVPSGLCLYFISSSLWGICERQLLKKQNTPGEGGDPPQKKSVEPPRQDETTSKEPRSPGFIERLLDAADQAKNATEGQKSPRSKGKQSRRAKHRR